MLWNLYEDHEEADISILERIFSTMEGCPFQVKELTIVENGEVSRANWISVWQMLMQNDVEQVFEYALYLGYRKSLKNFITIVDTSNWTLFGSHKRLVLRCAVVEREAKFLNKFIGASQEKARLAAISLPLGKTLIITEVNIENLLDTKLDLCLFAHNGTKESADFIINHYKILPKDLPKAVIHVWKRDNEEKVIVKDVALEKVRVPLNSKTEAITALNKLVERS